MYGTDKQLNRIITAYDKLIAASRGILLAIARGFLVLTHGVTVLEPIA